MPIVVAKDSKTKMIMARVVPSKGVDSYAVETVKKMVERLGHRKIIMKSDNEPAILALKEAVRRESDVERRTGWPRTPLRTCRASFV